MEMVHLGLSQSRIRGHELTCMSPSNSVHNLDFVILLSPVAIGEILCDQLQEESLKLVCRWVS